METHRYSRQLRNDRATLDCYDSLALTYPRRFPTQEYWTNGTTTLLSIRSPPPPSKMDLEDTPAATSLKKKKASLRKRITASATKSKNVVHNSILAGSIAGVTSTSLFYPFEVLRTKMQSSAFSKVKHKNPLQVWSHTFRHGGVRALYTGLSLPLTAQAIYKATVFTVNKASQQFFREWKTLELHKTGTFERYKLTKQDKFWCGALGGAVNAAVFVTPVEFVRNQLIAQHTQLAAAASSSSSSSTIATRLSGPVHVLKKTLVQDGLFGLWKGVGITVARDSFGCGCFFLVFGTCQEFFPQKSVGTTLLSGAAAGLSFWAAALPLDTLKTLVQNGTAPSASVALQDSLQRVGLTRTVILLCRGWQVALGRGAPSAAVTVGTYEFVYKSLDGK